VPQILRVGGHGTLLVSRVTGNLGQFSGYCVTQALANCGWPTCVTTFQIVLLAYNLLNWFKRLCAPAHLQRATLQRLRQRLFLVPSQLVRPGGVPTLRLAPSYPYAAEFDKANGTRDSARMLSSPKPTSLPSPNRPRIQYGTGLFFMTNRLLGVGFKQKDLCGNRGRRYNEEGKVDIFLPRQIGANVPEHQRPGGS
jgi:hypothetical protein